MQTISLCTLTPGRRFSIMMLTYPLIHRKKQQE
uniref:Uncharacterized protein n=1 Tax=Arundo donax TaxID=35708 RepID=A0A0A8YHP6_ARUDO